MGFEYVILIVYLNNDCTKAPRCYVIPALPVLFFLNLTAIHNLKVSANVMFCNILSANNISYLILSIFTINPQTRFHIPR